MLWLCLDCPALGREALGADDTAAVLAAHGPHRWLITEVAVPKSTALPAGMSLAAARARMAMLGTLPRQPLAEQEQLEAIAHRLYLFGSPVVVEVLEVPEPYALPRWRVAVEIGASLSLFGGIDILREQVLLSLMDWDCTVRCGIAPTRSAAGLLASAGESMPCLTRGALPARLQAQPIRLLPWPARTVAALASVGFHRLGDLFALPREGLHQRFGAEAVRDLGRLLGERAEPFVAIEPPSTFAARFQLTGEVGNIETLLFPLKRMTQRFAAYLNARALTAMHCRLELQHDVGAATIIPLQLLSPSRDAARWLEILRERLYRAPPDRAVRELHLTAHDFLPITGSQAALFDEHRLSRERQALLEKLAARYGNERLWQPGLAADHRPERAQTQSPPDAARTVVSSPRARRPLWLLPVPKPIAAPPVDDLPERIQTGWWDFAPIHRDYHWHGGRWIYRDLKDGRWHVHGFSG